MNNLLHQEGLRCAPIRKITKTAIAFFVFSSVLYNNLNGQHLTKEEDNKIVYLSYLIDDISLNSHNIDMYFEDVVINSRLSYETFPIETSNSILFHFFGNDNYEYDTYSVQIFKIPDSQVPYYLMKFDSKKSKYYNFISTLWIRVSGYTLCDLKVFFDKLQEKGMDPDQIRTMTTMWGTFDAMFNELDWECLWAGYEKNETTRDCFLSQKKVHANRLCIGCSGEKSVDEHTTFSNMILLGDVDL